MLSDPATNIMLLSQKERIRQGEYVQLVTAQQSLSAPLTALLKCEPIACLPSTALEIVLEKMVSLNIGAVVIVNEAQEPVGIFTERDVLRRVVLARADLRTPIAAFMTPHPVQLASDVPAYEAALAMATHAIRHFPSSPITPLLALSRSATCSPSSAMGCIT